jgi:dienelactone hydrolase
MDARFEIVEEEILERVTRQRIRFRTEEDEWVEAYLLLPRARKGKVPGIVVLHSTIDYHIRQPAGLEGPADKHIGLHLAERGFVTLSPPCYIFGYRGKRMGESVAALKEKHPHWTGMLKMLFDAQRALDVLERHPAVDKRRLGAIGHSLGGKETLYLAAFDERVKAAVSSEGGIGLSFSNWDAPWYVGGQIKESAFKRDHHELLALVAPRAFLLIGGDSADGDKSQPYIDSALPVYRLLGKPETLSLFNHKKGHEFPESAHEAAYGWLAKHLGRGGVEE